MSGERDPGDDIAQAATAPGSSNPPPSEAAPIGNELGRFKIQRELGRGGMGVVHAAFDPDLERKVALKVLRGAGDNEEARQRLLREARAMARVTHPNVLTVHEVGNASGQDFIAMELVDGSTLDDWLAAEQRSEREIVGVYVAAGRGLAAAHAAGLVHRDFKPRNVLRHKDGRILVTDFGLVVGVAQQVDATTTTLPTGASADSSTTPSSLSGLTETGALLGTPAYMAPEQWSGADVGPPADQFAFCVALWEALAKERPYRGKTLAELQDQVTHGERGDDAKLPRRLRPILRRGLDPDPAKRFASMDELLAAIMRAERPRFVIPLAVSAALAVVAIVYVAFGRAPATVVEAPCAAPALSVDSVWSANDRERMRAAKQPLAADAIERDFNAWSAVRARACKAAPELRHAQLSCLDGVLANMEDQKLAILEAAPKKMLEITTALIDPAVCDSARPARLVSPISPERHAIFVSLYRQAEWTHEDASKLVEKARAEPCASAEAQMLAGVLTSGSEAGQYFAGADKDAQRCGDDRVQAKMALGIAQSAFSIGDPQLTTKIERAEALIDKAKQPDLEGTLEQVRAEFAMQGNHADDAIARLEHAIQLYDQRHAILAATKARIELANDRWHRATPADLKAIPDMIADIRTRLVAAVGKDAPEVDDVDELEIRWLWWGGDIAAADKRRATLVRREPLDEPRPAHGKVVDEHGAPVPGATVVTGQSLSGDSLYAAVPSPYQQTATTDANGRFEIANVEVGSIAIAQAGTRRSEPIHVTDSELTLTVRSTSRVSGTVALHGRAPSLVSVVVLPRTGPIDVPYNLAAPVQPDGTFVVEGVPRGAVRFRTQFEFGTMGGSHSTKDLTISQPVIENVQLEVKASVGTIHVLVRTIYGEEMLHANVFMLTGKYPTETTAAKMNSAFEDSDVKLATLLTPDQDTGIVHAKSKKGDLYVLANRPADPASACAMPLPEKLDDPELEVTLRKPGNYDKIGVRCVPIDPKDEVIVLALAPWPRFD